MKNEYLLIDIETDGLKPTQIFMISMTNLITRESSSYIGDDVAEALIRIQEARMVVGHYIKGFDLRVIKKLSGIEVRQDGIVDTLDMSRNYCNLKSHKLASWGEMFEYPKLDAPLFEKFTPEMVPYCERDVDLNVKLFDFLIELYQEKETKHQYYTNVLDEYIEERTRLI